jgi:hypothetical protein
VIPLFIQMNCLYRILAQKTRPRPGFLHCVVPSTNLLLSLLARLLVALLATLAWLLRLLAGFLLGPALLAALLAALVLLAAFVRIAHWSTSRGFEFYKDQRRRIDMRSINQAVLRAQLRRYC